MPQIVNHTYFRIGIILLLLTQLQCKSISKPIVYGKDTFEEQLHTDIATCIAYLEDVTRVKSREKIQFNIETAATIYEQIKPVYHYINNKITLRFFEHEIISEKFDELQQLIADYATLNHLIYLTEEILEHLVIFQKEALKFKIKTEEYSILIGLFLEQINKDLKIKNKQNAILYGNVQNNLEMPLDTKTQEKIHEAYITRKKHTILSHLKYQKFEMYLRTLQSQFQQEKLFKDWMVSIDHSKRISHPNTNLDSTQIAHLTLEFKKQNKLLRKTLNDWQIDFNPAAYANTVFEEDVDE